MTTCPTAFRSSLSACMSAGDAHSRDAPPVSGASYAVVVDSSNGHVFISYMREDAGEVDRLQRALQAAGIAVWLDTAQLWPGEDWRIRIKEAISGNALVFLACFSSRSAARKMSYQNEELRMAIEQLRLRRPDDPWLIPVRFDDCELPNFELWSGRMLGSIQRADLFGEDSDAGLKRLVTAVSRALKQQDPAALQLPDVRLAPLSSWSSNIRNTVDVVTLTIHDDALQVLLVKRRGSCGSSQLALPGGIYASGVEASKAIASELPDPPELDLSAVHLKQLAAYGAPERDPRGPAISIAYIAIIAYRPIPVSGADGGARWVSVGHVPRELVLDHNQILADALEHVSESMERTPIATAFCGREFTIDDLRRVYEIVWNVTFKPQNFGRMIMRRKDFIEPTGAMRAVDGGQKTKTYKVGSATRYRRLCAILSRMRQSQHV